MLQIRLRKESPGDSGGGAAKPPAPAETVTVACPDHLVIANLPVAKGIGAVTASAVAATRSVGHRSRRHLGERVHFCVRCDFPIAIYGRLFPCEHAFCLTCARSDSSCYICDERIQKIQSIKMMEGIFTCAAAHCLKSFLKRTEFESHIHEIHADLLQPKVNKEGGNETSEAFNMAGESSADPQKVSLLPESSSANAPLRPDFSPNSSSQLEDHEERTRRHPPPRPPLQPNPAPFHSWQQHQPNDMQAENNHPQSSDRLSNWYHHPENFGSQTVGPQYQRGSDQFPPDKQAVVPLETSLSNHPPLPQHLANYPMPMNANQAPGQRQSISYPSLPTEIAQPYYNAPYEVQRLESGSEQGSVLGVLPVPTGTISFPDNCPPPWSMGLTGLPLYPPLPSKEAQLQGGYADHSDGKGVSVPLHAMSLPPPPPLGPHPSQQPANRPKFSSPNDSSRDGRGYK
uniref:RING-type E3 ubiquitin transferase n=1 Tax=Elaeis guineensis var. tenera TaxID=51953 RepID=A0A6I9R0Y7_ELAGV|nr:E3 ubiquitin-protein ligase HAKAI homolog isoform X2 [Elaeis guineensis]